ncbi:MAG TPA: twin-arginine translocation signal domain-containing protein [Telluria sp.]|nr:twin-arginine translocation signal domain-containing protein [Telluria sp.]
MDEIETKALNRKRRQFLRAASGAGALAVVAAHDAQAAPPPVEAAPAPQPAKQTGYHETEHIRTYYRTAAYW